MRGDWTVGSVIWLAIRSAVATALLPGVVAGFLPWRYFGVGAARLDAGDPIQLLGLLMIVAGVLLLLACIFEFARSGKGTLAPVDPPRELVVRGLYRYVRNPMYVGVFGMLLGEAFLFASLSLLFYV